MWYESLKKILNIEQEPLLQKTTVDSNKLKHFMELKQNLH